MNLYRFPPNLQAQRNDTRRQALRAFDELLEAMAAINDEEDGYIVGCCDERALRAHVCRECWDVIQAVEGVLRQYADPTVKTAYMNVLERCRARGDYGED